MPTVTIAPGATAKEPVISANMIITANGEWATLLGSELGQQSGGHQRATYRHQRDGPRPA
jgi:hypothetical protein